MKIPTENIPYQLCLGPTAFFVGFNFFGCPLFHGAFCISVGVPATELDGPGTGLFNSFTETLFHGAVKKRFFLPRSLVVVVVENARLTDN